MITTYGRWVHLGSVWLFVGGVLVQGYLAGAAWNVTVRRFSETMVAIIPFGLILFIPVALGIHELYHWSHAEVVSQDKILQGKAIWLNPQFFMIRA